MYAKISTKRDINRNDATKVVDVIRDIVKVLTVAGMNASQLNGATTNTAASSIIDNQNPGWAFSTSTKDGSTLGSGSSFAVGDTWTVTKGSKSMVFTLADTTPSGFGDFGIEVHSSTNTSPVGLFPGNDIVVVTGEGSDVVFGTKAGILYSV